MIHIRGHLTETEWGWLKDILTREKILGDDDSRRILDKISTNEVKADGRLGIVTTQNVRG